MTLKQFIFTFFLVTSGTGIAQNKIELPNIEGDPHENSAPSGWVIFEESPDIIAGNGPWPSGTYTMEDINGGTISGKSMGLFLANSGGIQEGWTTILKNLKVGKKYSISIQWQQCTLTDYSSVEYKGGELKMQVDSTQQIFKSKGGVNDGWQTARIDFIATATSATLKIQVHEPEEGAEGSYGCAIVVDNQCEKCKEAGF